MADRALILGGRLLPSVEGAGRDVRRPIHARVTRFRAQVVVRHLDHFIGVDRLHTAAFIGRDRHVHPALHAHLRRGPRLDDLHAARVRLLREILRRRPILLEGRAFGVGDHRVGVRLPRIGALPQSVPVVLHLLHEVHGVQAADRSVLGPSGPIGEVTEGALADGGLLSDSNDIGRGSVAILGKPVHRFLESPELAARERASGPRNPHNGVVISRQGRRRWRRTRHRRRVRPFREAGWNGTGWCRRTLLRHDGCPEDHACDCE